MKAVQLLSYRAILVWFALLAPGASPSDGQHVAEDDLLHLQCRKQVERVPGSGEFETVTEPVRWQASRTAIIICDMWDRHWCRGATRRVAEMAPRMNEVIALAREKGVLIIHCPSGCMASYDETPMRRMARQAPQVPTQVPLKNWCPLDRNKEPPLPIDDSDGGCDCWPQCVQGQPWKRQIATLEIKENDAITDSAEAFYLIRQRGIDNVIVMGVHTNMCVLGRPFSIRQLVNQGLHVVLMRDLTDTMYNSRMEPYVAHVEGTRRVIAHIERYWCPTIESTDFVGGEPFQFAEANRAHVVFMIGEREYHTQRTLTEFAERQLEPRGLRCTLVHADPEAGNAFPGLKALKTADLLFVSVRRRALSTEQMRLVKEYCEQGKPVIGIRTASHAFHTHGQKPAGHAEWQEFDAEVLGGNYHGHHREGQKTKIAIAPTATHHPILKGIDVASLAGNGTLYQVRPLAPAADPLLMGTIDGAEPEPVAWTHAYRDGRIFYTSLGHPEDFANPEFVRLLVQATFWALDRSVPEIKHGSLSPGP